MSLCPNRFKPKTTKSVKLGLTLGVLGCYTESGGLDPYAVHTWVPTQRTPQFHTPHDLVLIS